MHFIDGMDMRPNWARIKSPYHDLNLKPEEEKFPHVKIDIRVSSHSSGRVGGRQWKDQNGLVVAAPRSDAYFSLVSYFLSGWIETRTDKICGEEISYHLYYYGLGMFPKACIEVVSNTLGLGYWDTGELPGRTWTEAKWACMEKLKKKVEEKKVEALKKKAEDIAPKFDSYPQVKTALTEVGNQLKERLIEEKKKKIQDLLSQIPSTDSVALEFLQSFVKEFPSDKGPDPKTGPDWNVYNPADLGKRIRIWGDVSPVYPLTEKELGEYNKAAKKVEKWLDQVGISADRALYESESVQGAYSEDRRRLQAQIRKIERAIKKHPQRPSWKKSPSERVHSTGPKAKKEIASLKEEVRDRERIISAKGREQSFLTLKKEGFSELSGQLKKVPKRVTLNLGVSYGRKLYHKYNGEVREFSYLWEGVDSIREAVTSAATFGAYHVGYTTLVTTVGQVNQWVASKLPGLNGLLALVEWGKMLHQSETVPDLVVNGSMAAIDLGIMGGVAVVFGGGTGIGPLLVWGGAGFVSEWVRCSSFQSIEKWVKEGYASIDSKTRNFLEAEFEGRWTDGVHLLGNWVSPYASVAFLGKDVTRWLVTNHQTDKSKAMQSFSGLFGSGAGFYFGGPIGAAFGNMVFRKGAKYLL